MDITLGEVTEIAKAMKRIADYDITDIALCGNINEQAHCDIINIAQNGHVYSQALCNIFEIALQGSIYSEALKNIMHIVKDGGLYNDALCGICNITEGSDVTRVSGDIIRQSFSPSGMIYDKAQVLVRDGNLLIQDQIGAGTIQHVRGNWDNLPVKYNIITSGYVDCVIQLDYPCSGCCWDEYSGFVSGNWNPDIDAFFHGTAEYFSTFIDLSSQNLADDSVCDYNP